MRPRLFTAEDPAIDVDVASLRTGFNEAAAIHRGRQVVGLCALYGSDWLQ